MNKGKTSALHTIGKALELIELIADGSSLHKLVPLADRIGLSQIKTSRLLAMLMERGIVEHDKEHGSYLPGINSIRLSQKILDGQNIIKLARPFMESLEKAHDEAVYVVFMKDTDVVFMDMVDTEQQVKAAPVIGQKFPFFTNAAGKVIRALESRELAEWLPNMKREKAKHMPDPQKLASELLEIRSNGGVATDCDGLGEGISSVAVAVKDYAGKVIGAITLLAPSFRMVQERIEKEIIPSLVVSAALISAKFGYMPA